MGSGAGHCSLEGCVSVQLRAPRDSRAYEGAGVNQQMLSGLAAELGRVSRPDPGLGYVALSSL